MSAPGPRFQAQHARAVRAEQRWAYGQRYKLAAPRQRLIPYLRQRELETIFRSRWGLTLPDDDAGRDDP
jgi:hypothetical protein